MLRGSGVLEDGMGARAVKRSTEQSRDVCARHGEPGVEMMSTQEHSRVMVAGLACFSHHHIQGDFIVKSAKQGEGLHLSGNILMVKCSRKLFKYVTVTFPTCHGNIFPFLPSQKDT